MTFSISSKKWLVLFSVILVSLTVSLVTANYFIDYYGLFRDVEGKKLNDYYFVHSYFFDCKHNKNIIGITNYGKNFTSFVSKENIYGVQFHPEKSSKQGLKLIKNFLKL